ncbi:hypothetical protein ACFWER_21995, partial [Streptomyces sp. NPDC060188]
MNQVLRESRTAHPVERESFRRPRSRPDADPVPVPVPVPVPLPVPVIGQPPGGHLPPLGGSA